MDSFQYLFSLERFGVKFGLANIRTLCAALGDPQTAYPSALIAGTNGKGSVTAMVDAGLRAAGLKVGRFTSPHLIRLEERFTIGGDMVATSALEAAIDRVRRLIDQLLASGALETPPTFFEVTTAVAFDLFRAARIDVAVLEVGLGGRLDSTNCVEPVVAAITSIAFDHEQYLGRTLAKIAAEKAGVIRPGIPVIVGPLEPEAREVIARTCADAGARLIDARDDVEMRSSTEDGRTFLELKTPVASYGQIPLGLRGAHQIPNALIAVRMLEELGRLFPIDPDAVASGLRDVTWPGRLQLVDAGGGCRVLLDAAHNPAGATALAEYLKREFRDPPPLIFGAMRDKDVTAMLRSLLPVTSSLIATEPSNSRAWSAEALAALAQTLAPDRRIDIARAPMAALERAWSHGSTVCAAGSIFLVGDLLEGLGRKAGNL